MDEWDALVIYLIAEKLDYNTKKEWETITIKDENMPSMKSFVEYLESRCHLLEKIGKQENNQSFYQNQRLAQTQFGSKQGYSINKQQQRSSSYINVENNVTRKRSCPVCQKDHQLYMCEDFLKLPDERRLAEIKNSVYV